MVKRRKKHLPKLHLQWWNLVTLIIVVIVGIFLSKKIHERQDLRSRAETPVAKVTFDNPYGSTIQPAGSLIKVWVNVNASLAYAHLEINFDPKTIKLVKEVELVSPLSQVIELSTMSNANQSGKITFTLGIRPASRNINLVGTVHLVDMYFAPINPLSPLTQTTLSTNSTSQLISLATIPFTLNLPSATYNVGKPSPTPTPTPVPTPKPSTTPTPLPTPTPSLIPTPVIECPSSSWCNKMSKNRTLEITCNLIKLSCHTRRCENFLNCCCNN